LVRPPLHLDDVAADFPDLTIIMAHPAVPWQEEQLAVVLHKGNVYMDLSGWSPKYFRPILTQYATSLLQDKVLFGSDYPVLQPERWLKDFEALEMKPEVRQKILLENARKLLNL
jgi:predicted TIM-barrel fold metal-dependent hydrolase